MPGAATLWLEHVSPLDRDLGLTLLLCSPICLRSPLRLGWQQPLPFWLPLCTACPQHPQSLLSGASCDGEGVISHDAVSYSVNLYLILSGSLAHSQKSPGKPFADC